MAVDRRRKRDPAVSEATNLIVKKCRLGRGSIGADLAPRRCEVAAQFQWLGDNLAAYFLAPIHTSKAILLILAKTRVEAMRDSASVGQGLGKPTSPRPRPRWSSHPSRIFASAWYGHTGGKALKITSGIALRYRPGTAVLPVRWVLVRDPDEKRDPQAFSSTDIAIEPADIIALYVRRWQTEVTFAETHAHLGVETQCQ